MGRKINCVLAVQGEVWCWRRGTGKKLLLVSLFFSPDLFAEGADICMPSRAICLLPRMPRKREAF